MGTETGTSTPSPTPSALISTTPSPSETPASAGGSWDTTIALIGIILAVAALAVGIRKPDVSTPLKALLSVLETVVLLVSVVLYGWLGLAVFSVSAIIAFVLYGISLAMRQESLLVNAAIESDTTKEEMEAVHKRLHRSHTAFKWLGPIRTADLIRLLGQRARSPREIEDMALPIAMLFAVFQPSPLENLVERFDRLLRLSGEPASEAMRIADTLTRGTQVSAANFNETLDALLAFYGGSGVNDSGDD